MIMVGYDRTASCGRTTIAQPPSISCHEIRPRCPKRLHTNIINTCVRCARNRGPRFTYRGPLQIQRGLLLPIVIVVHVQLLLSLLLLRPQLPHQIREAARPRQAARLLLGQLVRVAGRAAAASRRVQRALARSALRAGALHQRMAGVQQQMVRLVLAAAAGRRCARIIVVVVVRITGAGAGFSGRGGGQCKKAAFQQAAGWTGRGRIGVRRQLQAAERLVSVCVYKSFSIKI